MLQHSIHWFSKFFVLKFKNQLFSPDLFSC